MGRLEAARGNFESAAACFEEAISTLRMIRDHFELAATYLSASTLYVDLARAAKESRENRRSLFDTARAYTTEAAHLFDSLGLARKASECERAASRILNENGGGRGAPAAKDNLEFRDEWLLEGFVIARSTHMKKVVAEAGALAPSNIPVLITGDTGTGKEVVARLIHALSGRPEARFVALNCASIPDAVFESELFGHRRGAFTGADRDHPGIIEQATGGTLFLDEISELTVSHQAKLLRVFQEQKVRRIGESRERPVDVRIVSASNRNVDALLRSGRIRDDFYYRVLTASIGLEPLRRRRDDIKALFSWYMRQSGGETTVEDGVLEHLEGYHWPGNVRQLISVVSVLSLIGVKRGSIGIDDLPMKIRNHHILGPGSDSPARADVLKLKEIPSIGLVKDREEIRRLVVSSLLRSNGNKTSAARELGISRSTMYRMLKSLDIG